MFRYPRLLVLPPLPPSMGSSSSSQSPVRVGVTGSRAPSPAINSSYLRHPSLRSAFRPPRLAGAADQVDDILGREDGEHDGDGAATGRGALVGEPMATPIQLDWLPMDVHSHIAMALQPEAAVRLLQCSQDFSVVATDTIAWKERLQAFFGNTYEHPYTRGYGLPSGGKLDRLPLWDPTSLDETSPPTAAFDMFSLLRRSCCSKDGCDGHLRPESKPFALLSDIHDQGKRSYMCPRPGCTRLFCGDCLCPCSCIFCGSSDIDLGPIETRSKTCEVCSASVCLACAPDRTFECSDCSSVECEYCLEMWSCSTCNVRRCEDCRSENGKHLSFCESCEEFTCDLCQPQCTNNCLFDDNICGNCNQSPDAIACLGCGKIWCSWCVFGDPWGHSFGDDRAQVCRDGCQRFLCPSCVDKNDESLAAKRTRWCEGCEEEKCISCWGDNEWCDSCDFCCSSCSPGVKLCSTCSSPTCEECFLEAGFTCSSATCDIAICESCANKSDNDLKISNCCKRERRLQRRTTLSR